MDLLVLTFFLLLGKICVETQLMVKKKKCLKRTCMLTSQVAMWESLERP